MLVLGSAPSISLSRQRHPAGGPHGADVGLCRNGADAREAASPTLSTYVVAPGDSLYKIAAAHGVSAGRVASSQFDRFGSHSARPSPRHPARWRRCDGRSRPGLGGEGGYDPSAWPNWTRRPSPLG